MKSAVNYLFIVLGSVCGCVSGSSSNQDNSKSDPQVPNIVLVLVDDQRYDAFEAAGHPFLETPNIDRLASEGVMFKNAFTTTSLCSPSRSSILNGMYAHLSGVPTNEHLTDPDPQWPTFPELLQNQGYRTAFIGKWHMARHKRPRAGFDHWVSFYNQGNYYGNELNVNNELIWSDGYITDELTEYALDFIDTQSEHPFLLYLSHKAVHSPFTPAPRHQSLFQTQEIPSMHRLDDNLSNKQTWRKHRNLEPNPKINQSSFRNYYRSTVAVDESLGRIISRLEQRQILDNTVIIFTSDNGFFQGEHGGMTDKRHAYEASIRIPMMVRYPKRIEPGTVQEQMVLNLDIMPSILDIAEISIPENVQGQSWWTLLDSPETGRESFLYEYFYEEYDYSERPTVIAVRTNRYKYITYPDLPGGLSELYDLVQDPFELFNQHNNPEYTRIQAELVEELERLKQVTNFKMDPPTPRENIEMIQMWQKMKGYKVKEGVLQ